MTDRSKALVAERSLACFGMISRSMTHEMNNVLATINELSGLLDDYLAAAEEEGHADFAKLRALERRIAKQVERGEGYVGQLNRFAHTMDHPRGRLDVRECLAEMVGLCQRLARLRKVNLSFNHPDAPVAIVGSAFELQHLAFRCIELCLVATAPGGSITVGTERAGDMVRVGVAGNQPVVEDADLGRMEAVLATLAGILGGRVERGIVKGRPLDLTIVFPRVLGSLWSDPGGE